MITYTEFFLFIGLIASIVYGAYWRFEAHKMSLLFKLMLTNNEAREQIVNGYHKFLKERT